MRNATRHRDKWSERELPSTVSFPEWVPCPGLSKAKARRLELHLTLPCEWRGLVHDGRHLKLSHALAEICIGSGTAGIGTATLIWDACITSGSLIYCATTSAPAFLY